MKHSTGLLSLLIGVAACVATGQVFADAIITSATRHVSAAVESLTDSATDTSTSGTFSESVSVNVNIFDTDANVSADQDSSIGVLQFEGTGNADIDLTLGEQFGGFIPAATATSSYEVFFDLGVDHPYTLLGFLNELEDGVDAETQFLLIGPGTNINLSATTNAGNLDLTSTGLLGPGSYHLLVLATSESERSLGQPFANLSATATWNFDLTLQVLQVPEPATLALLGIGLAGLAFSLRKRS